jgi:Na+-transporting NADH:ubiquinone oxidoreductase subunit C
MAFNKEGNGYVFGFTVALIAVVGTILASVSMGLKDKQAMNNEVKKKMDILAAIQIESSRDNAVGLYDQYITSSTVIDKDGNVIEGDKAFGIDVRKQHRDKTISESEKRYPLYLADKDGKQLYIIPVVGKGLWGPIWGYVALEDDKRTIFGVSYDHQGETPGLGAEIKQKFFTDRWLGEKVADESLQFAPITVVKDGSGQQDLRVDGITGGTITSKGVEEMMNRTMSIYMNYFQKLN